MDDYFDLSQKPKEKIYSLDPPRGALPHAHGAVVVVSSLRLLRPRRRLQRLLQVRDLAIDE